MGALQFADVKKSEGGVSKTNQKMEILRYISYIRIIYN